HRPLHRAGLAPAAAGPHRPGHRRRHQLPRRSSRSRAGRPATTVHDTLRPDRHQPALPGRTIQTLPPSGASIDGVVDGNYPAPVAAGVVWEGVEIGDWRLEIGDWLLPQMNADKRR